MRRSVFHHGLCASHIYFVLSCAQESTAARAKKVFFIFLTLILFQRNIILLSSTVFLIVVKTLNI